MCMLWYPASVLLGFWTIGGGIIRTQTQKHLLMYFHIVGYPLFALWEAVFERLLHWRKCGLYLWEQHCSHGTLSYSLQVSRFYNCSKQKIFSGVNWLCIFEVCFTGFHLYFQLFLPPNKFSVKVFAMLAFFSEKLYSIVLTQ